MSESSEKMRGLHQDQPCLQAGEPLEQARAAMIMVHGRGASAQDILGLSAEFKVRGFAYLAPQAAGYTWYPYSFLAPIASNEPWLSSALSVIASLLDRLAEHSIPADRTINLGFSQGACLSLEFVARHARRYGGVAGLSGALIGPDGTPRDYPDSLDGTPVFLGCSDIDPHIPKERVLESADILRGLGAHVTSQLYAGMAHTVNLQEVRAVQNMMTALLARE
jgi:predicted esterase